MEELEKELADAPRPRTLTVLMLLAATGVTLSYLGAYAVTGALQSAELITWEAAADDPRPRWFITGFLGLSGTFAFIGAAFRLLSWRQLRRIDSMVEEVED